MCTDARRRQAGLTMIELIVFIVIIGVAVTGVLGTLVNVSASSGDPLLRKQALLRAESLLEEVSLAHFTYCHPSDANAETATSAAGCATLPEQVGPLAGETRPYFNINDYVGAFNSANAFNPADPSGNVVTDVTGAIMQPLGYNAKVTVRTVPAFGPAGMAIGLPAPAGTSADAEVLQITVTVGFGIKGDTVVLERYRTRYAPNSMP
jgi:MSHA pilin protein MshD